MNNIAIVFFIYLLLHVILLNNYCNDTIFYNYISSTIKHDNIILIIVAIKDIM